MSQSSERICELKTIRWSLLGSNKNSIDCDDANEFLMLSARFLQTIGVGKPHPFFDLAELLNIKEEARAITPTINDIVNNEAFPLVRRMATYYVLTEKANNSMLRNVYNPIVRIFHRGGLVDYHDGEIIVDAEWHLPLHNWIKRFTANVAKR